MEVTNFCNLTPKKTLHQVAEYTNCPIKPNKAKTCKYIKYTLSLILNKLSSTYINTILKQLQKKLHQQPQTKIQNVHIYENDESSEYSSHNEHYIKGICVLQEQSLRV